MPTHYIPDTLVIVSRPTTLITQAHTGKTFWVAPAFVVPEDSKKMLATARGWASRSLFPGEKTSEVRVPNASMKFLQIVGVEHRSEGGIAFKVITERGFYVDLREPEFMEALLTGKIGKDGFIEGEYVWSVGGNQMRIVRVGSEIYQERLKAGKAAVAANGKSRVKTLGPKDLIVGHRYESAMNGPITYGGRIRRLSDNKLCFAWYHHIWSGEGLGRGVGKKAMTVSSSSFALRDLGDGPSMKAVPLVSIEDTFGSPLSRDNLSWPNGDPIRTV